MSTWTSAGPLVVGHRGVGRGRGEGWPRENTLAAFEQAQAQGATAIELDVRTCEGEVIVLHDAPRESLAALRAAGVPSLAEALAWGRQRSVAVNVEMKHEGLRGAPLARATARIVAQSGADVLLSSFDPYLLSLAAALARSIPRALLVHRGQRAWADALQWAVRPPVVQALHLERTQTDPRAVARHLALGLRLGVWTVNDPAEAIDLVRLGVETIITDTPGTLLAALRG